MEICSACVDMFQVQRFSLSDFVTIVFGRHGCSDVSIQRTALLMVATPTRSLCVFILSYIEVQCNTKYTTYSTCY